MGSGEGGDRTSVARAVCGSGGRASPRLASGAELRDEVPALRRPSSADPNLGYAAGSRVSRRDSVTDQPSQANNYYQQRAHALKIESESSMCGWYAHLLQEVLPLESTVVRDVVGEETWVLAVFGCRPRKHQRMTVCESCSLGQGGQKRSS